MDLNKERKPKVKKSAKYEAGGEKIERKGKFCPKCGEGVFMAEHSDRYACGKCGFMQKK
jgi:small subunit ribosomal protein S27Ae